MQDLYGLKQTYAGYVRILLARITKSKLASELNIQNTQTIDQWTARQAVPTKYHYRIDELLDEYVEME